MKISVVIICWNAEKIIEETLRSALMQKYDDFEIVIVDGASTDSTLDIVNDVIKKASFPKERLNIISERDRGIYDAMNKGVGHAQGDYIIFMNCGDKFYNEEVLAKFGTAIEGNPKVDVYYGNTLMRFYEGDGIYHEDEFSKINPVMPFIHQSALTQRQALLRNPFDLRFRICADLNLYFHLRQENATFTHLDFIVSIYDAKEGLSENNPLMIRREKDRIFGYDENKGYWLKKIKQRCTIGLIQPIKNFAPRWLLNIYFRRKKKYIIWV